MKKALTAFAFVLFCFVAQSQVKFGAKLGGNFYTLGGDDTKDTDIKNKLGFHFGFLANFGFSEHFSVQPEVYYSIQGAKFEDVGGVSGDRVNYNFNYLNVPILLQFTSDKGIYGEFGPQVGFLMSAKNDYRIGSTSGDVDIKDQLKGTDFSLCLGAGWKSTSGFGVGARYNLGMNNISDDNDDDLKNRGYQVSIFYMFNKGGKAK